MASPYPLRDRQMTEKGAAYNLETRNIKKDRLFGKLTKTSTELSDLLAKDPSCSKVKSIHQEWLHLYDCLLEAHENYFSLLTVKELQKENYLFQISSATFRDLKSTTEELVFKSPRARTMESKQIEDDLQSNMSRYTDKSVASQISAELLSESTKRADLLARAASLEEKLALEQEKFRLKIKEELKLKTKIKVSDTRSKILKDLEKSMIEDNTWEDDSTSRHLNGKVGQNQYASHLSNNVQSPKASEPRLLAFTREMNKPKAEIHTFSGNLMDFSRFMRQFNARVTATTDSFEEKLNYLLQFTDGEAHKIVKGYSNLNAEVGYKAGLEELSDRYGDPEMIAQGS